MLYWLKRGIVKNRKELAQLLHHNEATISRWLLKYRCGGLAELLEVKRAPGNPGKIPPVAVARLQQRLSQPEGFHSYGEAQEWLEQECGVKAAYKTVQQSPTRLGLSPNAETKTRQSFPFCLLPSALCLLLYINWYAINCKRNSKCHGHAASSNIRKLQSSLKKPCISPKSPARVVWQRQGFTLPMPG